jgi:hypothetical protein
MSLLLLLKRHDWTFRLVARNWLGVSVFPPPSHAVTAGSGAIHDLANSRYRSGTRSLLTLLRGHYLVFPYRRSKERRQGKSETRRVGPDCAPVGPSALCLSRRTLLFLAALGWSCYSMTGISKHGRHTCATLWHVLSLLWLEISRSQCLHPMGSCTVMCHYMIDAT